MASKSRSDRARARLRSRSRPLRVGLVSLGCAKNLVDAEIMVGSLLGEGFEITNRPEEADAVIVNTCAFIRPAQQESVDAILESDALRRAHRRGQALVVAGCLPQRHAGDLIRLLPEVDAFIGIDQVSRIGAIVREAVARRAAASPAIVDLHARPTYLPDCKTPRFRLTPRHHAYLKIAEGCNHPCSFCVIPRVRGPYRSRAPGDLLEEARRLIGEGVREINLISQDSTYYGRDLRAGARRRAVGRDRLGASVGHVPGEAHSLPSLLRALDALPGDFWIRLLYTHPAHWTNDLIRAIAECRNMARYVDLPLQHIHDDMLCRMRRETSRAQILDLLARIRAGLPGITLRTTFIVGFPGETGEHFEALLDFIRDTRFERLGVFAYSQEEGTVAGRMAGQLTDLEKQRRAKRAMAVQQPIARAVAAANIGRTLRVLVDGVAGAGQLRRAGVLPRLQGALGSDADGCRRPAGRVCTVARSEADAPDIDPRVYIRGRLPAGAFARVRIVGHTDYDLIAVPDP